MAYFTNTTDVRRQNMKAIRSKGNRSTELRMRGALISNGIRGWTTQAPLYGKPDFFFGQENLAVFVDGCFWHGCPICGHIPKSNSGYWEHKLTRNKVRDGLATNLLRSHGV